MHQRLSSSQKAIYIPHKCTVPTFLVFSFHGASVLRKHKNDGVAMD